MATSTLKKQHAKNTLMLHFGQDAPMLHIGLGALMFLYWCTSKCQQLQTTLVLLFGPITHWFRSTNAPWPMHTKLPIAQNTPMLHFYTGALMLVFGMGTPMLLFKVWAHRCSYNVWVHWCSSSSMGALVLLIHQSVKQQFLFLLT